MLKHRFFDSDITIVVAIFLIPSTFQLPPPAVAFGNFYITVVELLVIWFYVKWAAAYLIRRTVPRPHSRFDGPFLFLLIFIFCHLLFDISRNGAAKALGDFRQYLPLFIYHPLMSVFRAEKLARIKKPLFNTIIIVAAYVVLVFAFFRDHLFSYALANDMTTLDQRVFFDNTIFLLFMYVGYILWKAFEDNTGRNEDTYWLTFLLTNICMLTVMQVRTQWVIFACCLVICGWRSRSRVFRSRIFFSGIYISLLSLSLYLMSMALFDIKSDSLEMITTSLSERAYSLIDLNSTFVQGNTEAKTDVETIGGRVATASTVLVEYILPNMILGVGLGGEIPMVNKLGSIVSMKYQIDNGFLTILAKYGIPGLCIYIFVFMRLISSLGAIIKDPITSDSEKYMAQGFFVGLCCMAVGSLFSSIFIREQTSIIAFLLMLAETEAIVQAHRVSRLQIASS